VTVVIVLLEEKCLWCSEIVTGTIELRAENSRTHGDFEDEHGIDVQNAGNDRVLKAINVSGVCRGCGTPFFYKAFSVMQMKARGDMTPGTGSRGRDMRGAPSGD
jgi:hypothetical protein